MFCLHSYKTKNSISIHCVFNIHGIQCLSIHLYSQLLLFFQTFKVFCLVNINSVALKELQTAKSLLILFSPSLQNCGSCTTAQPCTTFTCISQSNIIPGRSLPNKAAKSYICCFGDFARAMFSS